jgi:ThiF family
MSTPPEYFSRIIGEVNFPLLQSKRVVVVGVGQVGSKVAAELANAGVGHLRFIDHDVLETSNLFRHVLPAEYVDDLQLWNKADALAVYLAAQVTGVETASVPARISRSPSNKLLDSWLGDADLVVAATDDAEAQLEIGARALTLGIPAIFPALFLHDDGGEIIVQLDNEFPCFGCAMGRRRTHVPQPEGVSGLAFYGLSTIVMAVKLALAILEPGSEYAKLITPRQTESPHQFFELDSVNILDSSPLAWLAGCPSCGGNPEHEVTGPPPVPPDPPEDNESWENRSTGIRTSPTPRSDTPIAPAPPISHAVPAPSQGFWRDRTGTLVIAILLILAVYFAGEAVTTRHIPAEISESARIRVNYHESLAKMISATHLPVNVNHVPITEKQFPVTSGPAEVEVVSLRLTDFKSNDPRATGLLEPSNGGSAYLEVQHKLSEFGYRSATLPELLTYLAQDSGTQGPPADVILAGPAYRGEYVTCGVVSGELQCSSVAEGFDQTSEFLAVHK